ncbi:MAG: 4'-phosphopantetheinyl transferase superfamily protein [Balneolales bacterium]
MNIIQNGEHPLPQGLYIGYAGVSDEPKQAELLLKELADAAGLNGQSLKVLKKESGKPFGKINDQAVGLSLTHTDQVICYGIYLHGEIGLDMESKKRNVAQGLRERIINKNEAALVTDIETIRLWTIKEAALKMTGTGLRTAMKKVEIQEKKGNSFKAAIGNIEMDIRSLGINNHWISAAYSSENLHQ